MTKSGNIEIRSVGNGFFVTPSYGPSNTKCFDSEECLVFQSMVELQCWLQEHFAFRSGPLASDRGRK